MMMMMIFYSWLFSIGDFFKLFSTIPTLGYSFFKGSDTIYTLILEAGYVNFWLLFQTKYLSQGVVESRCKWLSR
jgi:hypothetical protein